MVDAVADFQTKCTAVIVLVGAQANELGPDGPTILLCRFLFVSVVGPMLGLFVVVLLDGRMFVMADAAILQEPDESPGAEQERAGDSCGGDIGADLRGLLAAESVIQRGADSAFSAIRPERV